MAENPAVQAALDQAWDEVHGIKPEDYRQFQEQQARVAAPAGYAYYSAPVGYGHYPYPIPVTSQPTYPGWLPGNYGPTGVPAMRQSGNVVSPPGAREGWERYGFAPPVVQTNPWAWTTQRAYVDQYGRMGVQPLVGEPSPYPHVLSGVPLNPFRGLGLMSAVMQPIFDQPLIWPAARPAGRAPVRAAGGGGGARAAAPARQAAPAQPAPAPAARPGPYGDPLQGDPYPGRRTAQDRSWQHNQANTPYPTRWEHIQYGVIPQQEMMNGMIPAQAGTVPMAAAPAPAPVAQGLGPMVMSNGEPVEPPAPLPYPDDDGMNIDFDTPNMSPGSGTGMLRTLFPNGGVSPGATFVPGVGFTEPQVPSGLADVVQRNVR